MPEPLELRVPTDESPEPGTSPEPETAEPEQTTPKFGEEEADPGEVVATPVEPGPKKPDAESAEPSRPDFNPRRFTVFSIVAVLLVAIVSTTYFAVRDYGPVEVVENFFAAIADKDVEGALGYVGRVGYGVPYGERATFLHPDAIADGWRLLDAEYVGGPGGQYVEVTIGDDASKTSGRIEVADYGGEWNVIDPFVEIEVSAPAFTYIAVNDRRVVTADLHRHNVAGFFNSTVQLLPGRYTFWGDAPGGTVEAVPPVDLLPPTENLHTPRKVTSPKIVPTPETVAAVQSQVDGLVDDCTTFATQNPRGCPFGVGDALDVGDRNVWEVHDVGWEIVERPVVALDGAVAGDPATGLAVTVTEPGLIRLTARGRLDGKEIHFRADCGVDGDFLRAALRPDGTPEVYPKPRLGMLGVAVSTTASTCEYKGKV